MDLKLFTEITHNVAIIASIAAAGWWFLYTARLKPRIQFDIEVSFLDIMHEKGQRLAEIKCVFENKGFVEHKIYDLALAIYGIEKEAGKRVEPNQESPRLFPKMILDKTRIVAEGYQYYFVRPGVAQVITEIRPIPANLSAIRVLAGFTYSQRKYDDTREKGAFTKPYRKHNYPHTAVRVFDIPPRSKDNKA